MAAVNSASLQPDLTDFQAFQITQLDRRILVHRKDVEWSNLDREQFEKEDAFLKAWADHYRTGRFPGVFRTIFCQDQVMWNFYNPTSYQHSNTSRLNRNAKETAFNRVHQRLKLWANPHYLQDPDSRNTYYLSNMDKLLRWPCEEGSTWVTNDIAGFREHKIKLFRRQPANASQYQVTYRLPHQLHMSRIASARNAQSMIIPSYGELEPPEYLQSGLSPDGDSDCHPPKFIDFDRIDK